MQWIHIRFDQSCYKVLMWGLGVFLTLNTQAQIGGRRNFEFLQVPGNARLAGLGRVNVSLHQGDPNVLWQNPALIDSASSRKFGFNYTPYFADIKNTHLDRKSVV